MKSLSQTKASYHYILFTFSTSLMKEIFCDFYDFYQSQDDNKLSCRTLVIMLCQYKVVESVN